MTAQPIPFCSTGLDGDDVILQNDTGRTVRVDADTLLDLRDTARNRDAGFVWFHGVRWGRDHLNGAVDLAIRAGLIPTCTLPIGRGLCDRPGTESRRNVVRCAGHERT